MQSFISAYNFVLASKIILVILFWLRPTTCCCTAIRWTVYIVSTYIHGLLVYCRQYSDLLLICMLVELIYMSVKGMTYLGPPHSPNQMSVLLPAAGATCPELSCTTQLPRYQVDVLVISIASGFYLWW